MSIDCCRQVHVLWYLNPATLYAIVAAMLKHTVQKINETAKRHNLYRTGALLEAFGILVLSVLPSIGGGINSGMIAHGCAYSLLSFTIALQCRAAARSYPFLTGAFLAGMFGAVIELIQFFIPYRSYEAGDLLINFCSAGLAMIPGSVLRNRGWI